MDTECPGEANGMCDGSNNNEECVYDGGDCCLDETLCSFCEGDGCVCHATGQFHCSFGLFPSIV